MCLLSDDGMWSARSTDGGAHWGWVGCREGAGDGSIPEEHPHPQCKGLPDFGTVAEMYPNLLELSDVSRHDIAGIWVAFFSRCQRHRCGQARGASRQRQLPWSAQVRLGQVVDRSRRQLLSCLHVLAQVSEWLSSSRTTTGPLHNNGGTWQGEDAGHSLSFFRRMWFHTWFSGAACARCQ